jgi:hypothetical protein
LGFLLGTLRTGSCLDGMDAVLEALEKAPFTALTAIGFLLYQEE